MGNYHDSSGGTHTVTCGAEVGADHPNGAEGEYRYLLFVGATDCNEGVVTQTGQAKLWDVANLQRSAVLATAPAYSFYGKEGNSLGYYTRVHDQQSQQIEFNVTLSLPMATGDSQWTNLPEGCSGINTRTATCRWYSPYFQTIPYPPNSDQAEEDNDNVDNVGDPVASPFVDENSPPETAFAPTTPPTRAEIDAAEGRVYGLPAGATPADAPTWVQQSEFFQEVSADPRFLDGSVTFHGLQAAEFDARAASFRDCLGGEFCMFEHKLGRGRYLAVRLGVFGYPDDYGLPSRWEHRVSSARNNNRLGAIRALYHTQHNHCLPYGYVWPRLGHDDDNMFYIYRPGGRNC